MNVVLEDDPALENVLPYEVQGPPDWTAGVFRMTVTPGTPKIRVEGMTPIVQLSYGSRHVQDKQWERRESLIDLISAKDAGASKFYLVTAFDLFDDRELTGMYMQNADTVRQQTAELMLSAAKNIIGDKTVYAD